ncbi:MAG: hypothetical protein ABI835_02055 [Chloroflexota bacterium]
MTVKNFPGSGITSKQYLMQMEGSSRISKPTDLVGHSFSNYATEQIDRIVKTIVGYERGQIVECQLTVRSARQTGVTFTVQFGNEGAQWTPLLSKIERGNCTLPIWIKNLCPPNDDLAHFFVAPEVTFNPPTFVNDLITIDETGDTVDSQSEAQAPLFVRSRQVGAFRLADLVPPLYAAAVVTEQCSDCDAGLFDSFYVGGGAGGVADAAYLAKTTDRFGATTVLTTGIPVGNSVVGLYADGDIVLAAFADNPIVATAATGGTAISGDGGLSFTLDGNLTAPIFDVDFFMGQYIAVGGVGAGQALLYVSDDGVTWTSIVSAQLPATQTLLSIAVDKENEIFYISGTGGTLLKGTKSGETITLSALAPTGVSTSDLNRVAVFGSDHLAVGGVGNYYAESFDRGVTWVRPTVPGSADIYGIAGISYIRSVVGTGSVIADRTILSDNNYVAKVPRSGATITGNYRDVVTLPGEHQYFLGVTDAGEVVLLRPMFPGA